MLALRSRYCPTCKGAWDEYPEGRYCFHCCHMVYNPGMEPRVVVPEQSPRDRACEGAPRTWRHFACSCGATQSVACTRSEAVELARKWEAEHAPWRGCRYRHDVTWVNEEELLSVLGDIGTGGDAGLHRGEAGAPPAGDVPEPLEGLPDVVRGPRGGEGEPDVVDAG